MRLDALIQKYNTAGPRYTSYPTAVQFADSFDCQRCVADITQQQLASRPLSLYLHIPFCAKICYYCGCNKVITPTRERASWYLTHLNREIEQHSSHIDHNRPVEQLHFGGGTPTYISSDEIGKLMDLLRSSFNMPGGEDSDYSIEIDPRECSAEKLQSLREFGFNRISLGVQDLNPQVQAAVNRIQPFEQIEALIKQARALAFKSINVDLIYGLPLQNANSFSATLDKVVSLSPDRLSIFNYAHLPARFKAQRLINDGDLPSAQEKLKILTTTIEQLRLADYRHIGMDHFAKADDELAIAQDAGLLHRNFQGYSSHKNCDLLSFGASAISQIGDYIYQNHAGLKEYQHAIAIGQSPINRGLVLKEDDRLRAEVIMQLICHFSLDKKIIEQNYGIRFDQHFSRELTNLTSFEEDGLVVLSPGAIEVTDLGRFLIRNICMQFDAYLPLQLKTQAYSKVI